MLFAEITGWGWAYTFAAVVAMLLALLLGTAIPAALIAAVAKRCGVAVDQGADIAIICMCFMFGGMGGMCAAGYALLQLAIWLGFRHGDLPTLPG